MSFASDTNVLLFDRRVKVTLAKPTTGSFVATEPNAIEITDLRVSFKIEKKLQKNPNKAEITIYNLNEQTRTFVQKKPLVVRLEAGYKDQIAQLWTGDMTFSSSTLDGVDWKTTIEINNAERSFNYARCNRSFKSSLGGSNTAVLDLVNEVSDSMELPLTMPPDVRAELTSTQIRGAYTMRGPSRDVLDKVLLNRGYEWSLQDNQIQILKKGQLRADRAFLVSQDTGMIGSPQYNAPKVPGKSAVLKVVSLLYADLVPGQKIKVESRAITGVFRLDAVIHVGDTHSKEWFSELECSPVSTG